jgi:hypothetical protein
MTQPVWKTPAGSLGTIAEGDFYQIAVEAEAAGRDVFFRVIAGQLPEGVQLNTNGVVSGIPKAVARVQGIPQEVAEDVTSRFAIRAYTINNGTVDRLADRTFTLTVTGQDVPDFVTPAGLLGAYYDGSEVELQIQFTDPDPGDRVVVTISSGQLPPGLTLDRTGRISGIITPATGIPGTAEPGYDRTAYDQFTFDFATRSISRNYQFSVELTDGKDNNIRTFEIYVYSQDSMTADNTEETADSGFITADVSTTRTPILLTPPGSLGRVRADNYFATRFRAIDFDNDPIEYVLTVGAGVGYDEGGYDADNTLFDSGSFSLPPGLSLDTETGYLYGYIPDQGATEATYRFGVRVRKRQPPSANWSASVAWQFGDIVSFSGIIYTAIQNVPVGIELDNREYWQSIPEVISPYYYFTLTITGNVETDVTWFTEPDLGTVDNGAISTLAVSAVNVGGRDLQYRLAPGVFNRLPQGLTLQPSGHITGRVSFNTFALDGGTTTFDITAGTRLGIPETTFDLEFEFTVNAFAPSTEELGFAVREIRINNSGTGYTSQPTVTISAPPGTAESIQATAGVVTIEGGRITAIAVGNPGRGYIDPPTVTITGGGGTGALAQTTLFEVEQENAVSVFRTFTVRVQRRFNEPYETLQMRALPPDDDRSLLDSLLNNLDLIPESVVYRGDDANFGVSRAVIYDHAYGLARAELDDYVTAMQRNHSDRRVTLGPVQTAQALAADGSVIYEVIYSEIIDDLVNRSGDSVSAAVTLPYPVTVDSMQVDTVYPPSLDNMRDRVIDTVGRVDQALPLWMTSKQPSGRVPGFTRAWVIAYVKPGESGRVAYDIAENLSWALNVIDFEVDRYVLDQSQTHNWDPVQDTWTPQPPAATSFDRVTSRLYPLPQLDTFGQIQQSNRFVTDGTQTQFTVSVQGQPQLLVQINGVTQSYEDYRITYAYQQATITVSAALPNTETTHTADGSSTVYPYTEIAGRSVVVVVDGEIKSLGTDYQLGFNSVIFAQAPTAGETIVIDQQSTVTVYQIVNIYVQNPLSAAQTRTTFDHDGTRFIQISDRWTSSDQFDKYLMFPKRTILG